MASTQADTIELRVLYGPQAGARLALAAGHEYLLGTSPDCTVMLTGPRVAELHAQIIFDGSRPRIKPLDGTVCDAQGNQQDDEFLLTFGLPVELGGIWISVDHASAPWPDAEAVLPVASSAADPDPQSSDEAQSHLEPAAPETAIANHKVQAPSPAKKFPFVKALVTLGLVALSGSVLAVWLTDGSAPDASAVAQSNQTPIAPIVPVVPDPITQAIQEFGDTLTTSHDDKGNWVVSGYLPTTAKKKALTAELEFIAPRPVTHVFVDEELVAAANKLLQQREVEGEQMLHVENSDGGALRLVGAAAKDELVEAASKEIKASIPGVRSINASVALPDRLRELLKEKLSAARLADRLRFAKESPDVVLKGELTNEEMARWEALFIDFTHSYGNILPISANVGGEIHTVALNVQAIVGGPTPYIVTEKGERVNMGGTINGRTIVSIKDGIVLFDGNEQLRSVR